MMASLADSTRMGLYAFASRTHAHHLRSTIGCADHVGGARRVPLLPLSSYNAAGRFWRWRSCSIVQTMDEVKKKVYLDIFAAPGTLLPVAAGATALMGSWAVGGNPTATFAGIAAMLLGAGICATRLILGLESITERAYEHSLEKKRKAQEAALEHLRQRLLTDNDPRTQNCLSELRLLYSRLRDRIDQGTVNSAAYDVIDGVDQLFRTCINQLEHSVDLWETANTMRGPARKNMLEQRNELVEEICDTVVHLGSTVEKFHAVTTNKNRSELSRLRNELDRSIEVAKAVEARTEQLTETKSYDPKDFE